MTYTFKLARRLALGRLAWPAVVAVAGAACGAGEPSAPIPGTTDPLVSVQVAPKTATIETNETIRFYGKGLDAAGDSMAIAIAWSATGGAIDASGRYTAGMTPGQYQVVGRNTSGSVADTVPVSITAPQLAQVVLVPATTTVVPSGSQQFTAYGRTENGDSIVPAVTYSATGGTITAGGLYTAGTTPGTAYRVIVTQQGGTKADTSGVTVTAPPPTALVLATQPDGAVSGVPFTQQPVVQLRNAQNQPVQQSGVVVTASKATGTGTLSGPLSSTTNAQGSAVFTGLQITGTGPHTIAFAAPGLTTVTSATLMVAPSTLRSLAAARGFQIGAAVRDSALRNELVYRQTLSEQYNSIVPEDATDFGPIHPGPTTYAFATADAQVAFAQANGMVIHGHTLVWYSWIPAWVTNGGYTDAQIRDVLRDHILTVVGRYRGQVASWDVVNEVIDNLGCLHNSCGLQPSFWLTHLGPEYIDSAFVWARRADPAARLYLNDYRTETINNKSDSLLGLAKALKAHGIPIDGVGFQMHLFKQYRPWPTSAQIETNLNRFAAAGLDLRITEMDADVADTAGAAELVAQAAAYREVLDACLKVSRCKELTTWGFSDKYSWVPSNLPGYGRALPFDVNYSPKPAFDSLIARLRRP